MVDILDFKSTPIGSLVDQEPTVELRYLNGLANLPNSIIDLVMAPKTSAYIRGVSKAHQLPTNVSPAIAFIVLQIAFGDLKIAQLGSTLSSELKLPNDKAQAIAKELERDLFAPVMLDLNQHRQENKQQQAIQKTPQAKQAGARNVINLKEQAAKKPTAPPIPKPSPPPKPPPSSSANPTLPPRSSQF